MSRKKIVSRLGIKLVSASDFGGRLKLEIYVCPFCGQHCTWLHKRLIKPHCSHAAEKPGIFQEKT
jgi:hypothetical protein